MRRNPGSSRQGVEEDETRRRRRQKQRDAGEMTKRRRRDERRYERKTRGRRRKENRATAEEKAGQDLLGTGGCRTGRRYRLDMFRMGRGLTSRGWSKREEIQRTIVEDREVRYRSRRSAPWSTNGGSQTAKMA
jgi:hypothetical protein